MELAEIIMVGSFLQIKASISEAFILLKWRFEMSSPWSLLILAGLLEVCWAIGLKYTEGFTRLAPSIFTLITLAGSMYLLAKASERLPIGTAYAVWVGIGAVGAGVMGILLFKEPVTIARAIFFILLVVSLIGLKMTAR